jgi:hypothetical protein
MSVAAQPPGRLPAEGAPSARAALSAGRLALVLILALAAALRFATLDVQSFSDDEQFTAWLMGMSFGDLIETVPESEATPHLFYVLEWLVTQALGTGEVGMRILPALAGTLTVAVVYAVGAIGASRRVGLAAAALAAVNPFLVWFSQEARAYPLLLLFVALGLLALVQFDRIGSRRALAGWAIASALAIATHYFALFLVLPEAVWLLRSGAREMRERIAAVAAPAIVGAALLPLVLHQRDAVGDPGGVAGTNLAERLAAVPKNFLVGYTFPGEAVVSGLALLVGAALLVFALRGSGDERRLAVAAGLLAACGVALPLVVAPFGFDYVSSRNVIAALVPLVLALACGTVAGPLARAGVAALCALSIFVVVGVALEREHQRRDWAGAARELGDPRTARALIFSPGFSKLGPFSVYYGKDTRFYPGNMPLLEEIAVVALAANTSFGPGAPEPPDDPAPPAPTGFRKTEDLRTETYRFIRYVAPRPTRVQNEVMVRIRLPHRSWVIVKQDPRP